MSSRKCILVLFVLFVAIPLNAATAKRGWTKIELTHAGGSSGPFPPDLLARFGAEPIADYGEFAIAYAPRAAVEALTAHAAKQNVRIRVREELDVLHLPGAAVDTRDGIVGVQPHKLTRGYPRKNPGLFVLQFIAPLRNEWVAELESMGWVLSRYIPNDGYIVVGPPELAARTRQLSFVQWLDFFHPYQKATLLARDGASHDQLFELPAGAASSSAVGAIRAAAEVEIEVHHGSADTLVYARMTDAAAEDLLRHEMIISVSPKPTGQLSDERQVMSLTSNLNAAQTQPTSPGNYWSWVLARCTECLSMPTSTWRIGIADSGLDDGANVLGAGHADVNGRKFYGITGYGSNHDEECAPTQLLCDAHGHGTIVSGIAAGNGATGVTDSLGFNLGQGVAPTAGLFMTKIFSLDTGINTTNFFDWTGDAANNSVTIQNHSWNNYSAATTGQYSTLSRQYDIAARDGDDTLSAARNPLLMSVAAGNNDFGSGFLTVPGGTAKNVLAVGGLENYRPDVTHCRDTSGDGFRNIMKTSRVGTALPGYVKPDLMAPASLIVSAHTSVLWPTPSLYCFGAFGGDHRYTGDSGTSFAAPVGAGAALIVKRYLGSTPGATSPALTKAVLIAGARSVRGGEDRTHEPTITTIGPVPSQQQGFGKLSFEDILNGSQKPVVFDQGSARLFTQAGQVFRARLRIRDSAKPVKMALVWTDTPATAFVTNPLVNDLHLEVIRNYSTSLVHVGNSLQVATEANGEESIAHSTGGSLPYDNVNNVEYFRSFMNTNEEFEVAVKVWNLAGDTDPDLAGFEQDFALAVLNADLLGSGLPIAPILTAQTNPSVTTSVNLSWTPASNMMITRYDIYRGTSLANMAVVANTTSTSAVDSGLTANTAFVYKVVAVGPGVTATSNNDVATSIQWQSTVTSGTIVTAQHFTELRQGIDYVRTTAGLATNTWAETIASSVVIRAAHMNEMRDKLEQALSALVAPLPSYQFPDPAAGVSSIHDEDVLDLRARVH
ncbi:MAG TPA: S8 family serine peptidase [Thermoanaerobaculia bacterium]|jgi:hypothetical protein|nr:S8 family serine peptidase [Thermoanaerobaculia bacterium]